MGWGFTVILAPDEQCHHKERQRIESANHDNMAHLTHDWHNGGFMVAHRWPKL